MAIENKDTENGKFIESALAACVENDRVDAEEYEKRNVYRGLRDLNGVGVVVGLTRVSKIRAGSVVDGKAVPADGALEYRGVDVRDLIATSPEGSSFERAAYLLVTGVDPDEGTLARFREVLARERALPEHFARDVLMKAATADVMNVMARSVLTYASYDDAALSLAPEDSLRQCLKLTAVMPEFAAYAYAAYAHYKKGADMVIAKPDPTKGTAENYLRMIRGGDECSPSETRALDAALTLHAEHGGGNASTFTDRVVTSAGSDAYAAAAAALCSLKGRRHGGANLKVVEMMDDLADAVNDPLDRGEVAAYLTKVLDKEAFDRSGLVYGMGHAIYSSSDPRAVALKEKARELAASKGEEEKFAAYELVEEEALRLIHEKRKIYKGVCANVDFYSGFVYTALGIPRELFTPTFAVARMAGWSAHRMEELLSGNRIMRPAYVSV